MAATKAKHKINEVSKDFALESKKIIALVGEISEEPKKSVSVLTEAELNYIFDKLTIENSVKDFNEYFNTAKPAEKKAEPKKTSKKADTKKDEKAEKAPAKKAAAKKETKKPATGKPSDPQPFKKKEKKENQYKAKTKGEFRTIDTRASNIDLSKYDERFEEMGSSRHVNDRSSSTKQK